jgi:hypothetical protein
MKRSAMRPYAVAGAVSITAGLIAVTPTLLPGLTTTGAQTRAVQLTSGDSELITPFGDGTELSQTDVSSFASPAQSGYSFTDLIDSVQNTSGAGEADLTEAETAFADGNLSHGLSEALAGVNNLTVGVQSDFLVNGYAFLTGDNGNAGFELTPEPLPSDLATAFAEAQTFEGFAPTSFTDALTDFAAGNEYLGLVNLSEIGINSAYATDAITLGLFDSLLGIVPVG